MSIKPKIIVLTPIRNEEWILERFLSVASQFADHIIIADQNSTDRSIKICENFKKVYLVKNNADFYNEDDRQILLIESARKLVSGEKILLALDADEILTADSIDTEDWKKMLDAEKGTVFYFKKYDLFPNSDSYIEYPEYFPLGYRDDGEKHIPSKIHSARLPVKIDATKLYLDQVKIMHYTWTRPDSQLAKLRMYSVLENINKTNNFLKRRKRYNPSTDYRNKEQKLLKTPKKWFEKWELMNINMKKIIDLKFYWQDFEVLKIFHNHGIHKFWFDPIWEFDWEKLRLIAIKKNINNVPSYKIKKPPLLFLYLLNVTDFIFSLMIRIKIKFNNKCK